MSENKVDCKNCTHFRSAPYEARADGCYFLDNMPSKQSTTYLDEQQIAGNHKKINLRSDCKDHDARSVPRSFWRRLLRA
jgi:hypothetical protein